MVTRLFIKNKIMKKILAVISAFILSSSLYAQKEITKFLGIPVDGTKVEMIQKLKAKGFTSNAYDRNILEGEFNGTDVNVHIATNNNKVYRIMLCDKNCRDEAGIKIRFNNLCEQFLNNKKYMPAKNDQTLSDDERISYEMIVKKKRYEAVFYQIPSDDEMMMLKSSWSNISEEEQEDKFKEYFMKSVPNRCVWFLISELNGEYYISMFYDNEYNRANGEDL